MLSHRSLSLNSLLSLSSVFVQYSLKGCVRDDTIGGLILLGKVRLSHDLKAL